MLRTLALDVASKINQKIKLQGWVKTVRDHGRITFLDLRDRSGTIQIIKKSRNQEIKSIDLHPEDVVEIVGTVQKRSKEAINPDLATGKIEVVAEEIRILEKAAESPFDLGQPELQLNLDILLDNRPLSLRHPKIQAIFKLQAIITKAFRKSLQNQGFTEFHAPTIVPVATEGGAEIFHVDYYDYDAYLAQSPQLYKQIMVSVFERVFTIGRAYRAEPSVTTRHLSEYVTFDAEMGFIKGFEEIMKVVEKVFSDIFEVVNKEAKETLGLFNAITPKLTIPIPCFKLSEAQEIVYQRSKRDLRQEPDLDPEGEREICHYVREELGSELVFITHYPTKKRPFYTFPDPDNPELTHSFDLLCRGLEVITGGQRINNYQKLVENIKKWGNQEKDFAIYLQAFKYGMPPEGGFALGLERLTMQILGLKNVREASLFPRDMGRVDQRFSVLERKNG